MVFVTNTAPALRAGMQQLLILRWIAIAGQSTAVAISAFLGLRLPMAALAGVIGSLAALNTLTVWRLRRPATVSHVELATHLAIDLAALTALLYLSGGAANPFASLYVLHVVMMALLLPPKAAAAGCVVAVAAFALLWRASLPLAMASGATVPAGLLELAHSLAFALTAGVTTWFVVRVMSAMGRHDRLLAEAERKALRDEAVLRVGALAAGAAHELSTPLTTMALIAGEIADRRDPDGLRRDAAVLADQVSICRETIANMLAAAGHAGAVGGGRERLDRFLISIAERCRAMRPEACIVCEPDPAAPGAEIFAEQGLRQALLALLNNAVDASPGDVRIAGMHRGGELCLSISDRGGGLPEGELDKLGRAVFTTKPRGQGAGLGLVLARRAVERLGGTLGWEKRAGGGMRAVITLPWESLSLETRT